MDENLKSTLEKDEKILFKGKPESFETLDKANKQPFIITTVLTVLVCLALILTYTINTLAIENFKILVPFVIAAIGALIISSTFRDSRKIRKLEYVITNKRLMRLGDEISSMPFPAIKQYIFKLDEEGRTSLLIGEDAITKKTSKWRSAAVSSFAKDLNTGECEQAVFYAIPDRFRKIFTEQISIQEGHI